MGTLAARLAPLLIIGLLPSTACKEAQPPAPPPMPLPTAAAVDVTATDDERRCTVDADCTLTTFDCCGCNALGKQTSVRKDQIEALTERRRPICATIACAQGMSDDPSCSSTRAVCRQGRCVPDNAEGAPKGVGVEKIAD